MQRRIVSLWFPRLASDRMLRASPSDAPFAATITHANTDRLHCLNTAAMSEGLSAGMTYSDAKALCADLRTAPANLHADAQFQKTLARWVGRYSPIVGLDGHDGLALEVAGATHLFGGEEAMIADMRARLARASITAHIGMADTKGAAWALARRDKGIGHGPPMDAIGDLSAHLLRLDRKTDIALQRLGVRTVADLAALPRATVTRRFGPEPLLRLDQALGHQPEALSPISAPPHYGVRLNLPEPIGHTSDVMEGLARLLSQLCGKLKAREAGARILRLTCRRVDQHDQQVELRLARPMRDEARILPLFQRGVDELDAGFGIDQLRVEAVAVEALPLRQLQHNRDRGTDDLSDLITRLGNRIGLENIIRYLPADSHIPERSFIVAPAAYSEPAAHWPVLNTRPVTIFPPESIAAHGRRPPAQFRWRRMSFTTGRVTGPERITPEWWLDDPGWRSGLRDYWRVETREGRRLWLFHTPQNPGWYVQGEFA